MVYKVYFEKTQTVKLLLELGVSLEKNSLLNLD